MSEFQREEELLRRMLQRRDPRDGFAGRVLARLDEPERAPARSWLSWMWSPVFAAALVMLVLIAGTWQYQRVQAQRQQQAKAERALRQLERAMEITAAKLEFAQAKAFKTEERQ